MQTLLMASNVRCFDSRALMRGPLLLFPLLLPYSAHSQSRAVITSLDAQIEVRQNTDVTVDERVELELPSSGPAIVADLPKGLHNREGQYWTATSRLELLMVDGSGQTPEVHESRYEKRVAVLKRGAYSPGKQVIHIVYTTSSLFTADGDKWSSPGHNYALTIKPLSVIGTVSDGPARDEETRWFFTPERLPVQAATVTLIVPSDVPFNDLIVRPLREWVEDKCDYCEVELSPADHRITIKTARSLQADQHLIVRMYFPPSSLSPDKAERWRFYAQAHPGRVAWGQWMASVLAFLVIAAGIAGCTRLSDRLRAHTLLFLVLLALCAGIASVQLAMTHDQTMGSLAQPGFYVSVIVSAVIFFTPHGPASEVLILPVAMLAQALFYFGVGYWVFWVLGVRVVIRGRASRTHANEDC